MILALVIAVSMGFGHFYGKCLDTPYADATYVIAARQDGTQVSVGYYGLYVATLLRKQRGLLKQFDISLGNKTLTGFFFETSISNYKGSVALF